MKPSIFISLCQILVVCSALWPVYGQEPGKSSSKEEMAALAGTWQITRVAFPSQLEDEFIGAVHVFHKQGLLEIYAPTYEARFNYRIERPGQLQWAFADGKFTDCGIYQIEDGFLIWRTAHEPQVLDFKAVPKGEWNEYRMKPLKGREAEEAIAKMKAKRLAQKAPSHTDEN